MDIYSFDPETGEFRGTEPAEKSPLDGKWMVPYDATTLAPPATDDDQVAVFRDGAWSLEPDHRGVEYWLDDGSHHVVEQIGEVVPPDALTAPPEPPHVPRRIGDPREFIELFTDEELEEFERVRTSLPKLGVWLLKAMSGGFSLDHPEVAPGLAALVASDVITQERADEIQNADFDA